MAPSSDKKRAAPPSAPSSGKKPKPAASTPGSGGKSVSAGTPGSAEDWGASEVSLLQKACAQFPEGTEKRWEKVAGVVGTRDKNQCKKQHLRNK